MSRQLRRIPINLRQNSSVDKFSPQKYFATKLKNIDSHVGDMTFQIPDGTPL